MFNIEQLTAIIQLLNSSIGKDMLEKLSQAASNFTKKIPFTSSESNSQNFESTKNPSYSSSSIHETGLGIKTNFISSFLLGLLIGLSIALFRFQF